MALNLNRVEVIGNLTRDPELRYTPNGQAVVSFAVATNRRYQDQQGNWVDAEAEFHEVVAWAKMAEGINQVLKKGDRVYLSGRLQTRTWEGQDGSRRNKTEVVADTMIGPDQVGRASYSNANGPVIGNQAPSAPMAAPGPTAAANLATPVSTAADQTANQPASQASNPATTPDPSPAEPGAAAADQTANQPADDEIKIEDIPF